MLRSNPVSQQVYAAVHKDKSHPCRCEITFLLYVCRARDNNCDRLLSEVTVHAECQKDVNVDFFAKTVTYLLH